MRTWQSVVLRICRYLLAVVFLFSGFVKMVDPLGTAYKITDYLEAFGLDVLGGLALPAAMLMIAYEFTLGFNFCLNIKLKPTAWATVLFMAVMTPLTLYLAIANPVSDCGCFGDALVLTNWQTFYKNLFIDFLLLMVLLLIPANVPWLTGRKAWWWMLVPVLLAFGVMVYCYCYLPLVDFRPYKVGNNLPALMEVPEGAPLDKYEVSFVYERNGERKTFTLDNYPANDSTWKFVDQQSKLIEKGYVPPIHDFTMESEDDGDITSEVLEREGYSLLVISSKLNLSRQASWPEVNRLASWAAAHQIPTYLLTASFEDEVMQYKERFHLVPEVVSTDEITLKTIVRSNPGLVLIKQGTVVAKWPSRSLPSNEEFQTIVNL